MLVGPPFACFSHISFLTQTAHFAWAITFALSPFLAIFKGMLLIPGTGNGERGTGNRERESGNKCTAATLLRVQNGGQNKRKGSKRNNLG